MSTTGRNIDSLDGLRGCAVLLVVLKHLFQYYSGTNPMVQRSIAGWYLFQTGVNLFFVLSGFLLFLPYSKAAFSDRNFPSTVKFSERRALRILPAYWASLIIFVLAISLTSNSAFGAKDIGLHFVLANNLLKSTYMSINPAYWTMAIEVQFYLILPAIAVLVVSSIRRSKYWAVADIFASIGIVSVAAYAASLFLHRIGGHFDQFVHAPEMLQYLPVFGVGMAASLCYVSASEGPWANRNLQTVWKGLGAGGLILLGLLVVFNQVKLYHWRYGYVAIDQLSGVAYAAILLGVVLGWKSWNHALGRRWIRFIGMISYSMYIWNLVILQDFVLPRVDRVFHGGIVNVPVGFAVGIAVIVPLSLLSYLAFERPFIGARRSRRDLQLIASRKTPG
ncbi:MAG: acyltransferase [Acidimicrobiales bacterium]|nr:acyltransferase [Acidimicrobiales bacterium]